MSENITPTVETPVTPETIPAEVVTPNMSLNSTDQAWIQALIDESIKNNNETEKVKREFSNFGKKLMKFLFTPAKKLDTENASVKAITSISSFLCTITAYLGYIGSLGMIALALFAIVNEPNLIGFAFCATAIAVAVLIAVFAKTIEMAGIDIEKTQDKNFALLAAAFWIAFWPIARDFVTFVSDCL